MFCFFWQPALAQNAEKQLRSRGPAWPQPHLWPAVTFYFSPIVRLKGPACITRTSMNSTLKWVNVLLWGTLRPFTAAMRCLGYCEILLRLDYLKKKKKNWFASFPFIRVKRKSCFYIFLREIVPAFLTENIVFFGICTYLWEALPLFTAHPMNTWQIKLSNFDISGSQVAQCQFKWHNGAAEICVYFVVK